jgi:hypothetical protein
MSEKHLRELISRASSFAEGAMYLHGNVAPIWHLIARNGEEIIELAPPGESKDDSILMIKTLMVLKDVVRYVHFGEAWMVRFDGNPPSQAELDKINVEGARKHPDRIECVIFQAEDDEAGMISGHRRIMRDKSRPYLGPLELLPARTISEGRMVGLLPRLQKSTLQ